MKVNNTEYSTTIKQDRVQQLLYETEAYRSLTLPKYYKKYPDLTFTQFPQTRK